MKLGRNGQTYSDYEVGQNHVIDTFIFNVLNLHSDDRKEVIFNIFYGNPKLSVLEFMSTLNAVVEKLKE